MATSNVIMCKVACLKVALISCIIAAINVKWTYFVKRLPVLSAPAWHQARETLRQCQIFLQELIKMRLRLPRQSL